MQNSNLVGYSRVCVGECGCVGVWVCPCPCVRMHVCARVGVWVCESVGV